MGCLERIQTDSQIIPTYTSRGRGDPHSGPSLGHLPAKTMSNASIRSHTKSAKVDGGQVVDETMKVAIKFKQTVSYILEFI
jgi:hypothetical protein